MDRNKAHQLANKFVHEMACPLNEAQYVGELNGNMIFYYPRVNKGKYLGWPICVSVSADGDVNRLYPPELIQAMKLRNKTIINGDNI